MKKFIIVVIALFLGTAAVLVASPGRAQDTELLIEKLIEKGILSAQEGQQLLQKMREQSTKEKESIREVAEKPTIRSKFSRLPWSLNSSLATITPPEAASPQ